jgi:hypothetical protein
MLVNLKVAISHYNHRSIIRRKWKSAVHPASECLYRLQFARRNGGQAQPEGGQPRGKRPALARDPEGQDELGAKPAPPSTSQFRSLKTHDEALQSCMPSMRKACRQQLRAARGRLQHLHSHPSGSPAAAGFTGCIAETASGWLPT